MSSTTTSRSSVRSPMVNRKLLSAASTAWISPSKARTCSTTISVPPTPFR